DRGIKEIQLSGANEEEEMRAVIALLKFVSQTFNDKGIPAYLGTERDLLVQRITNTPDPYREKKQKSNEIALNLLPKLKNIINKITDPFQRFFKTLIFTAAANSIEFDIRGHNIDLTTIEDLMVNAEDQLSIDDSAILFTLVKKAPKILFLCDNAGEIAIDTLLVEELKRLGSSVTAVVRGGPILNDALLEDAIIVGMDKAATKVITVGPPAVGVPKIHLTSQEFQEAYNTTDLIIAKGMGNWESLPELKPPIPTAYILRTKCLPIARSLNTDHQKNVIKVVYPSNQK
ncbi:MAG: damage-control phosphatase ARMT1 family protein, partial [Candidatus Ranarchaeia archaeon]